MFRWDAWTDDLDEQRRRYAAMQDKSRRHPIELPGAYMHVFEEPDGAVGARGWPWEREWEAERAGRPRKGWVTATKSGAL